jgi:hypothetical protein
MDRKGTDMRARMFIGAGLVAVVIVAALLPTAALASPTVPQWVTDAINQVKALAQSTATQVKPVVDQAKTQIKAIATNAWNTIKGSRDWALIKTTLASAAAQTKTITQQALATLTPMIQQAAGQIKTIIDAAIAAAGILPGSLKTQVLSLLNSIKALIPAVPKFI